MNRRFAPVLALALVLVPGIGAVDSAGLAAQDIPSPYRYMERGQEAGLFFGTMGTNTGRFGLGPRTQTLLGARYGVEISGPFGFEAVTTMAYGPRDVVNPARDEGDRVIEEAEMRLVMIEARLRFALTGRRTWNRIQPFALVGVGFGFDTLGDQDEDYYLEERDRYEFGTRWTGNVGVGGRIVLTERLLLRVDGGLTLYKIGIPEGWRDADRGLENVPEDEWVSGRNVTVGLAWRF